MDIVLLNGSVFTVGFVSSQYFLHSALFAEADLSKARLNSFIFSFLFGFCVMMLLEFMQEVQNIFDKETSLYLWKVNFWIMDLILLVVIPLALIKDLCFNENAAADDLKHRAGKSTKKYSNKLCTGLACCCFAGLFLVDAFIFNMYFHEADVNI